MARTACQFGIDALATDFFPTCIVEETLRSIISQEDNDICRLTAKLNQLRRSFRVHEALFAPIRRLAPEILGEIFIHSISVAATVVSFHEAPLFLLQVCRRWRRVALGTPRLWTVLLVCTGPASRRLNQSSIIRMWMENSRALPVQVSFRPPLAHKRT
jgi:hypothetical protein